MKGKLRKKRNINVRPEDLDWSLSTRELAAKHDVSLGFIWIHRRRLAPHTIPKPIGQCIEWTTVNWQQTSQAIAKEVHCSPPTVSKMRRIYAPGTPDPDVIRQERLETLRQKTGHWAKLDWSLTTRELTHLTGATRQVIAYNRKIHAPHTIVRRGKHRKDTKSVN